MSLGEGRKTKDPTKMLTMAIIATALVLLLVVPLFGVLLMSGDDQPGGDVGYIDQSGAATGDASMDSSTKEAWEDFLATAPTIEVSTNGFNTNIDEQDLDLIDSLPDEVNDATNYDPPSSPGGYYGENDDIAMDAGDDDDDREEAPGKETDGDQSGDREVEEADIVKAMDGRIYVLNNYMGFLSVNMEDPASPYIEGRAPVLGTPVSMYIVDFLGFVIVSNAPSLDGEGTGSSGRLYILDLTDNTAPRIVDSTDLDGYPIDSRRVGEVIYVISNEYGYYYGGWGGMREEIAVDIAPVDMADEEGSSPPEETGPETTIVSIGFFDPENLGEIDREVINGDSGKIHASKFAIFIPQDKGDWEDPKTEFTYVDISDPEGEIKVKGSITINGYLRDRFQMDHYRGMFRVVTQENPTWEEQRDQFPASTMYIVDTRDPDEMEVVSDLEIDDEGNLMATRFAGDRAYTIHLPEAIDPLDVIDLSDPANPQLTDILEIPGWVEHMEVIGYNIIAIGVDNENERKVAIYLFDVTDPENAVQTDRVVIGEGHTYSEANWDEKALTILRDEGLIIVPYSSYQWEWYTGNENGVQLVSYDLEEGTLEVRGKITGTSPIKRSRAVNGNIVTTSDRVLQSIDFEDPDTPVVEAVLDLAANVKDAFIQDGKVVSMILPDWAGSGAKIRVSNMDTPYEALLEIGPVGLQYEDMKKDGNIVFIKGIRQGPDVEGGPYWEAYGYDMTDPMSPVELKVARMKIPDEYTSNYNYKYDDMILEGDEREGEVEEESIPYISYDPFNWDIIEGPTVIVYSAYNYYGYRYYDEKEDGTEVPVERIALFHWDGSGDVEKRSVELDPEISINSVVGGWDGLFIQTYNYRFGSELIKVKYHRGVAITTDNISVMGRIIGTSDDMDLVYTVLDYWWDEESHNTLNIYNVSTGQAVYEMGIDLGYSFNQVKFLEDRIVVISQDNGYYYGYGYPEDAVVYDEEGDPDDGVSTGSSDGEDTAPGEPDIWVEPDYKTHVHVIGIQDGVFETHDTYTIDGHYYSSLILEDVVLLNKDFTLMGLTFGDGELTEIGPWPLHGYVHGGDMEGEDLVIAMGLYGIGTMDL